VVGARVQVLSQPHTHLLHRAERVQRLHKPIAAAVRQVVLAVPDARPRPRVVGQREVESAAMQRAGFVPAGA
jgi:hypothetical protein